MTVECAYNIELLRQPPDRSHPANHGWCFGLPPGIAPSQWPFDPVSGHLLVHGFTLLLPEEYRVRGSEIVAVSFFAPDLDYMFVRPLPTVDDIYRAVDGQGLHRPNDSSLARLWDAARAAHPQTPRMSDLSYGYAIIFLTREEFDGELCPPPDVDLGRRTERPRWLEVGTAYRFCGGDFPNFDPRAGNHPSAWTQQSVGVPTPSLDWACGVTCVPRESDPNSGIAPRSSSYQGDWAPGGSAPGWAADHLSNHIGGTMRCWQAVPPITEYYVGIEEYFGGYNLGTGNGQLDIAEATFTWACD